MRFLCMSLTREGSEPYTDTQDKETITHAPPPPNNIHRDTWMETRKKKGLVTKAE